MARTDCAGEQIARPPRGGAKLQGSGLRSWLHRPTSSHGFGHERIKVCLIHHPLDLVRFWVLPQDIGKVGKAVAATDAYVLDHAVNLDRHPVGVAPRRSVRLPAGLADLDDTKRRRPHHRVTVSETAVCYNYTSAGG